MRMLVSFVAALVMVACAAATPRQHLSKEKWWVLRDVNRVADRPTEVVGAPRATAQGIVFDGRGDGIFVPFNPVAGWQAFTIEVRFMPDGSGGEEQRFLHIEDSLKRRLLMETRVTPDEQWTLDTFLFQDADHKRTLLDRTRLHATDRWYWVALVYDGRKMSHYVDGVLELEGDVEFPPMSAGRTSLGVRQNLVSWFKGTLGEVRFAPVALRASQLQTTGARIQDPPRGSPPGKSGLRR